MPTKNTLIRPPVAIGRFYPQNKDQLENVVPVYLRAGQAVKKPPQQEPWAYMLPHAGYMYCGTVLGATLAYAHLPETLIILCPNHTGRGKPLGVWPEGAWQMPLGLFPIAEDIVDLLTEGGSFAKDTLSHANEHSIEVLLPFCYYACGEKCPSIVPICVGTHSSPLLHKAAEELCFVLTTLAKQGRSVGVIVSSDMNHYESHDVCMAKDARALERIQAADADGLLDVCAKDNITMCGAAPMALLLMSALGSTLTTTIVAHTSSAEASGNYRQTVGYAGLHIHKAS
ncbi:MAG: AmmeMemoRadiSam system protein B [Desulfovibrio sp.]|nr:AmmeMemoRadiSam system protein B [Desulfovibrio sp.]